MAKVFTPNAILRLYAGILSFMCAEVLLGASMLWAFKPWTYIVTFPLYLIHILFFYSVAHHCKRKTLPDLYLFGVLFGLYETWVTKVVWAGYVGNNGFAAGSFMGHGLHETLGLVLFFHPVMSFLLPLALMGFLFPSLQNELGSKKTFFAKNKTFQFLFIFCFTCLAFGPSRIFSAPSDILLHWLPTLIVIVGGYKIASLIITKNLPENVHLWLSKKATIGMGIFVLFTYIVTYFTLRPEHLPNIGIQLLTLVIYGIIITLILFKKTDSSDQQPLQLAPKELLRWFFLFILATTTFYGLKMAAPQFVDIFGNVGFLLMIPAGCYLFWTWGIRKKA